VTSPRQLFRALQARRGLGNGDAAILEAVFPAERAAPMVTVRDGHPHTFLAGINTVRATHLGVTEFGRSGDLESIYRYHGLDAAGIVGAALDLVDRPRMATSPWRVSGVPEHG
jgi:pyruvate dehydrogenase E1 component